MKYDCYDGLPTTEMKINEILERVQRIEKMLEKLTGSDYSPKYPFKLELIDPESTAGNWHGQKGSDG